MTIKEAAQIRDMIVAGDVAKAANYALHLSGVGAVAKTNSQGLLILRKLLQQLLDSEMYLEAATMLWGGDMFNAEPECVRRVFESLHSNAKVLLQGASSMGKSYNAGAWMYLDWRRDPLYTSVKCVGTSEDQVRKHVFAHIVKLHRSASISMPEDIIVRDSDMWMGVRDAGFEFGITAIAYKRSEETSGGVKGYKSMAVRPEKHPQFGYMSRLRLLGDEGQNWPGGPFQDLNTWVSQIEGIEFVKIAIAYNPESISQTVVKMAEPAHGWDQSDLDKLYDWESGYGWRVCRLDAAKSENVVARKKIYHGLQTYDGFMGYLKAGGDTSPAYMCFARGFPPLQGAVNTVVPPSWPQQARGEAVFLETPVNVAAVDLAYMGVDSAQMAVGRWGLASGWTDSNGKYTKFMDRLNVASAKPRHVLQIDQLIPLEKHDDTVKMAEEIMGKCNLMEIKPEWVGVDKTGAGFGTFSHLNKVWGEVIGIGWGEKSTENLILAEDKEPASKVCDGVMSEMWWAFRRWLDPRACAVLINPIIPPHPIQTQLTSRRYVTGRNGIKVESKEDYKARNQKSPDEADALIMMVHVIRRVSNVLPGLVEQTRPTRETQGGSDLNFIPAVKMGSVEQEDSMCGDSEDEY